MRTMTTAIASSGKTRGCTFTAPADGQYLVKIKDVRGLARSRLPIHADRSAIAAPTSRSRSMAPT